MTDNDQKAGCGKNNTGADGVKMLAGLVKPLEWIETPAGQKYAPDTFGGYYYLDADARHWRHSDNPDCWRVGGAEGVQADYADDILAAIDTDAIAALVGAAKGLIDYLDSDEEEDFQSTAIRTALARLGGAK